GFAPRAKKIMVNVDQGELDKARPSPDLAIKADIGAFMETLLELSGPDPGDRFASWRDACKNWRERYPPSADFGTPSANHVNSYVLVDVLSGLLSEGDAVLTGNSLDAWSVYQAFKVKKDQRIFTNINFGAMGWDLPAAVGTCTVRGRARRTVLITGDGSFQ